MIVITVLLYCHKFTATVSVECDGEHVFMFQLDELVTNGGP